MQLKHRSTKLVAILSVGLAAGVVVGLSLGLGTESAAATFNETVDIGDKGAPFTGLEGTDGKKHSFADYKDAKILVLNFTCNSCPVARAYEDRFKQFTQQYKDKGVAFVSINVNNIPADRLDKMRQRAQEQSFNFDYLYDPSQEIARKYGATVTPHLFVLDSDRRIVYMGAFDDSQNPEEVKHHYVRDAVDALLRGETPEVAESRQFGCGIKYEKKQG